MAERQSGGGATVEVLDATAEPSRTRGTLPARDLPEIVVAEETGEHGKTGRFRKGVDDALEAAQREVESAKATERAAVERAEAAERTAAQATAGAQRTQVDERLQSVDVALAAAKTAKEGARAKLASAIESGDSSAIADAQEEIGTQAARIENLTGQKGWLEDQKKRAAAAPAPNAGPQYPPGDQAWINNHPLFHNDTEYRSEVIAAATAAAERGMQRGSHAYYQFIDDRMAKMYGDGHGQPGKHGTPNTARTEDPEPQLQRQHRGSSQSMGMPRSMSDEGSSGAGGALSMDTEYGPVRGSYGSDGKLKITMPREIQKDWSEAAGWANMSLPEYAAEQLKIAQEMKVGMDTGLRFDNSTRILR